MTSQEIATLARLKLLEEGTDLVTDANLYIYMNLAYQDVILQSFPNDFIKTATVTFVNGVGTIPADFGTLYSDALDANGNVFPEVSIADFARDRNLSNGVTIEEATIKASPLSTSSLVIKYFKVGTVLTSVSNPTINAYLHEPIVYGTVARAFEDLQDPEMATYYENKTEKLIVKKMNVLSNYQEEAQRGGTMFNGINLFGNGVSNDPDRW